MRDNVWITGEEKRTSGRRTPEENKTTQGAKGENQMREQQQQRREGERRLGENKDSQHEVLLPAGQLAPDSDGCALHILYFERHVSVKLLCLGQTGKDRMLDSKTVRTNFLSQVIVCLSSDVPSVGSSFYFWRSRSSPWGPSSLAFFTVETHRGIKITHRNTICFSNTHKTTFLRFKSLSCPDYIHISGNRCSLFFKTG